MSLLLTLLTYIFNIRIRIRGAGAQHDDDDDGACIINSMSIVCVGVQVSHFVPDTPSTTASVASAPRAMSNVRGPPHG